MKPLSSDTSPDAQQIQIELLRRLSPSQKLALAFELTDTMRNLILADLRHRFPEADPAEIRRRFIARVLSREDVIRAYGFDPESGGLLNSMVPPVSVSYPQITQILLSNLCNLWPVFQTHT